MNILIRDVKENRSGIMAPTTPSASPFLSSRTLSPDLSGPEGSTSTIHAPSVFFSSRVAITASLRSKVRALREHAAWSFRRIAHEIGVATSTVFSICSSPITPQKPKPGRPKLLTTPIRKRLIDFATASQANRRLPLTEIAEQAGVQASIVTLRNAFSTEGYHRRIARVRPFLSTKTKATRLDWSHHYADWTRADWNKVIWSDESAFNVGGLSSSGKVWVTRQAGEADLEDCLVPKFSKLQTIMVWACFKGGHKGPLIFWDKENWGKTITAASFTAHIVPHFHRFWQQESQLQPSSLSDSDSDLDSDYVYLQQDNASPHRAALTQNRFHTLGIWGYFIDWPPSSPDCSPIENVWRTMKQRIRQRTPFPTTNEALRVAIQEEWNAITSDELIALVDSVPTRVREVLFFFFTLLL